MRSATMADALSPPATDEHTFRAGWLARADVFLRGALEAGVLAMVCLSPWFFGAAEPLFEFALEVALALLLVGWAARMLLNGRLCWTNCPVAFCLAGLVLLGIV
jgi:hypothetical protein